MSTTTHESSPTISANNSNDQEYIDRTLEFMSRQLEAHTESRETTGETPHWPADADHYNYDDIEAQVVESNTMEPIRQNTASRLGLGWVRGGGLAGNFVAFSSSLQERRKWREDTKRFMMSPQEQLAYIDKKEHRRIRMMKAGAIALGALTLAPALKYGFDHAAFSFGGGSGAKDILLGHQGGNRHTYGANANGHEVAYSLVDKESDMDLTPFDKALLKHYNNSDSSFYDYSNKQFRGDFGPALQTSPLDGKMPPGFADAMSRGAHEPHGLANLISGLKLDGHGDSLQDRNALADLLDSDQVAHAKADMRVQQLLNDPTKFNVELIKIDFRYDSTLMVDNNGNPIIATKEGLNLGGTAFQITNKQTGEVTLWRRECGFYQQITRSKQVVTVVDYKPQSTYVEKPVQHEEVQHIRKVVYEETTVTPPSGGGGGGGHGGGGGGGGGGGTPPERYHKGNDYQKDPNVVRRGGNKFEPKPAPVRTTVSHPGQEGVSSAPIVDKHTSAPHSETGGASTHKDAGIGSAGVSENKKSGTTHKKKVSGD